MPVCQVFSRWFRGKKTTTQEHLFTSHRSACRVWVDFKILANFTRYGTNVIVAIQFAALCWPLLFQVSSPMIENLGKVPGVSYMPWHLLQQRAIEA